MEMLRLYSLEDLKLCPLDKWGIVDPGLARKDVKGNRENGTSCLHDACLTIVFDRTAEPLDVILLPGVAFDQDCNRVSPHHPGVSIHLIIARPRQSLL